MGKLPKDQPAILDYASPKKQTPMRLTDKSVLRVLQAADGFDVVESLEGQSTALAAILFSSFSVLLMASLLFPYKHRIWDLNSNDIVPAGIALGLPAITALIILKVIDSTWRRTILEIRPNALSLIFTSPLKTQRMGWAGEKIRLVRVYRSENLIGNNRIDELYIETWTDPLVKLFTGHRNEQLSDIATKINALCGKPPT